MDVNFGNDPCDQMVSIGMVVDTAVARPEGDLYAYVAAILGMERAEAKNCVYRYLYSGAGRTLRLPGTPAPYIPRGGLPRPPVGVIAHRSYDSGSALVRGVLASLLAHERESPKGGKD